MKFFSGLLSAGTASAILLAATPAQAQPANNDFANRIVLNGVSVTTTGSNAGANKETGEPNHAYATGGASVWWSWTAPYSGFVTVTTAGSTFDTVLGIYTGSSVSALTWIDNNDDEDYYAGISTSRVYCDVTGGQTYQIAVDGYGAASGSVRLSLQLQPFPSAPGWSLPDPFGATVNWSSYAGKVVIFDFWATWCGPCKVEIPDYVFLQQKYGADGLAVIGPSVDSTAAAVQTFLTTNSTPLNYKVVMSDYALEQAYGGISAIPTTFIIDRQNKIRKKFVGTRSRTVFERAIVPLLYGNTSLACRSTAGDMELCWAQKAVTFTLEWSTSPTGPTWSAWPTAPTLVNGTNFVTVPKTGTPRFFRLRLPY